MKHFMRHGKMNCIFDSNVEKENNVADMTFSGSCLCGAIQYEFSGEPTRFYHCHCQRCRKATGTGHATNLFIKPAKITWIKGEELLRYFKVPEAERFTRCFCQHCGSSMPRVVPELGMAMIPAGSLDSDLSIVPQARIFWDSRAAWSCSTTDIPVYPEYVP